MVALSFCVFDCSPVEVHIVLTWRNVMKFDLISDFHVEMNVMNKDTRTWKEDDPIFYAWDQDKKSDVLVIAGDTSNSLEYETL